MDVAVVVVGSIILSLAFWPEDRWSERLAKAAVLAFVVYGALHGFGLTPTGGCDAHSC